MSDFFNWSTSIATQQMLISGQHRAVVRELRSCWETQRILGALSSHREQLARITKRAKRLVAKWLGKLEIELRDSLGDKPAVRSMEAVEALIQRTSQAAEALLRCPPGAPVPALDRQLYGELKRGITADAAKVFFQALRLAPPAFGELMAEQERNPWLAAYTIALMMDPSTSASALEAWIGPWRRKARLAASPNAEKTLKEWQSGKKRFPPAEVESFISYKLGLLLDGFAGSQGVEKAIHDPFANANRGRGSAPSPLAERQPNESRMYTIKEAAREFSLKLWTIRRAIDLGELKCSRLTAASNAPKMIRDGDIRDWISAQVGKRQHAPRNPNLG